MNVKRTIKPAVCGMCLAAAFCILAGCGEPTQRVRRDPMWYRPPPKPPAKTVTFRTGRAGKSTTVAAHGTPSEARNSLETGAVVGRAGRSTTVGTDRPEPLPTEATFVKTGAGRTLDRGVVVGASGGTASVSSSGETGAQVGRDPFGP